MAANFVNLSFEEAPAFIDAGAAEPYALANLQTLLVEVDGGDPVTITFNAADFVSIGAATAAEVAAAITAAAVGLTGSDQSGTVRMESDTKGLPSSIRVVGGTATALSFSQFPAFPNPMEPTGWTATFTSTAEEIAAFDQKTPADTLENYENEWRAALRSNEETFALVNAQTLTVKVDGGAAQTVTFVTADFSDIANATAAEVATRINLDLTGATATAVNGFVLLQSDSQVFGAFIEVTGGTANTALGFSTVGIRQDGNEVTGFTLPEEDRLRESSIFGTDTLPDDQTNVEDYERQHGPYDGTNTDYQTKVNASATLPDNAGFLMVLSTKALAEFDTGLDSFEDYEEEHGPYDGSNTDYATKVGAGAGFGGNEEITFVFTGTTPFNTSAASFDAGTPETTEDYEEEWSNDDYSLVFTGSTPFDTAAADFDGTNAEAFEDYEEVWDLDWKVTIGSTGSAPAGDYTIIINGERFTHNSAGGGDSERTTIRDALIALINGSSKPVEADVSGFFQLDIRSSDIPPAEYSFNVDDNIVFETHVTLPDPTINWTWPSWLRTIP